MVYGVWSMLYSVCCIVYRGTFLTRNSAPLRPYSRTMPRALWWPWGLVLFLMSEVPLYLYSGGVLGREPDRPHQRFINLVERFRFSVKGLRFQVWGLGFRVSSSGLRGESL